MLESLTTTEWVILKTVTGDRETLEGVYHQLLHTPQPLPLADVAETIRNLIEKELLGVWKGEHDSPTCDLSDLSCIWKESFAVTPKGRESLSAPKPAAPIGRSRFGAWKDHGIDLKLEDLAEVRHEMWKNFPREFAE